MDRDASTDEYFLTAVQIFDYCGADSSGTLRVDALMEKFAPFVKTNKAEYSFLKSLLDPDHSNPEINVVKLARTLNQYSESQKCKVDLDESFNLKTGPMPQDSDSGISTEGYQMVEDLQCELREKSHLAAQLRSQLDYTDRQHEEAIAALTAERDTLRAHLSILREETSVLTDVRHDYEEACDRLQRSEAELSEARRELEALRKKGKLLDEQLCDLTSEKLTLQGQLTKSRDECHRINEMYASRQATLRGQNEALRTEHADLTSRLQDHDEFMQQIIKEKVLLEMELKELLNKSNHTSGRLDGSIEVSYTEDQMLTALDTLNADSRFSQDNRLLDEESFENALREEQGRSTNMSLFDEIRLSFCNMSRLSMLDDFNNAHCGKCSEPLTEDDTKCFNCKDSECSFIGTVIVDSQIGDDLNQEQNVKEPLAFVDIGVQTEDQDFGKYSILNSKAKELVNVSIQIDEHFTLEYETNIGITIQTQTDEFEEPIDNNNRGDCIQCHECEKLNKYTAKLESQLQHSRTNMKELQSHLEQYEENLDILQKFLDEGTGRNDLLQSVNYLQTKIGVLEAACSDQKSRINAIEVLSESVCTEHQECQTYCEQTSVSTQAEIPCARCDKRNAAPLKGLRRYLWDPLKSLFQMFAVVSFICAVSVLYGVTRRWNARCERDPTSAVPWRWLDAQEFMDLLLRIEYVADVPM